MGELKVCAFCSSPVREKPMPQGFLMFMCDGCGACVSFAPKGAVGSNDPAEFTNAEAREHWNTRPAPPVADGAVVEAPVPGIFALVKSSEPYAWAWHCNIAMPMVDGRFLDHRTANLAAARIMSWLFQVDVTKFKEWQYSPGATHQPTPSGDAHG